MTEAITVFDVETPNARNDKICSIGITTIKNGKIQETYNYLINPECEFSNINIGIHHITPDMVANKPRFNEIWPDIRHLFYAGIVVAHNATFDLGVLKRTLLFYGFEEEDIRYIDTVTVSKTLYPDLINHKLNTLCDAFNIKLDHHNSGSDCLATAELYMIMLDSLNDEHDFIYTFSMKPNLDSRNNFKRKALSDISRSLLDLKDILTLISSDGTISVSEFQLLKLWLDRHGELNGNYPFDSIYQSVQEILSDEIIEKTELEALFTTCNKMIDPIEALSTPCPNDICGKNIVLSGEFIHGSKSEVSSFLVGKGAIIQTSVTKKTNIVLVGGYGNTAWAAGSYGTKVKKALELQANGLDIQIIREHDLFEILEV